MIWFTADTHFNHSNIIKYCNRPFNNVLHMNAILAYNWNTSVQPTDTVYVLGDVGFDMGEQTIEYKNGRIVLTLKYDYLARLHGKKILICGNNDSKRIRRCRLFTEVHDILDIKINKQHITLCHYPLRCWPESERGSWHLHGHCHGKLVNAGVNVCHGRCHGTLNEDIPNRVDVGVDVWGYKPVSYNELVEHIGKREEMKKVVPKEVK